MPVSDTPEVNHEFGYNKDGGQYMNTKGIWKVLLVVGILAVVGTVYVLLPFNERPEAAVSVDWSDRFSVGFSSQGSYDPDGYIVSYYWDFGDGDTSEEPNPIHTYKEAGNYTVTLTVTDDDGVTSSPVLYVHSAHRMSLDIELPH